MFNLWDAIFLLSMKAIDNFIFALKARLGTRNQRGAFLVTSALMMTPIVGMAVLTTDVGMAFLVRTEASNAADLTALAAIKKFGKSGGSVDYAAIRRVAEVTAWHNATRNNEHVNIDTDPVTDPDNQDGDIMFGFYNHEDGTFTGYADADLDNDDVIVNALRSRISLAGSGNTPFTFQFANFMHNLGVTFSSMSMTSESIASFGIMNIVLVMDTSASMAWRTYKPTDMCQYSAMPYNQDRWFQRAARTDAMGDCENTLEADPVIGPVDDTAGVVLPQPMVDIFNVTKTSLLQNNALFQNLYRGGMITYDTTAYVPFSPTGSVAMTTALESHKTDMENMIDFSVDQWRLYAQDGTDWNQKLATLRTTYASGDMLVFPGGLYPPETTYTNTGDAIYLATNWIATANAATRTKSKDLIILLSDGAPNCYRPFSASDPGSANFGVPPICPRNADVQQQVMDLADEYRRVLEEGNGDGSLSDETIEEMVAAYRTSALDQVYSDYDTAGEGWSYANAVMAATHEIQIEAVYFATDPNESCDSASPSRGLQHLEQVAEVTSGHAHCAERVNCADDTCLSTIFEKLATERNFVLIHPDASEPPADTPPADGDDPS